MNISSFSRMRCYRKNGRIAVILKLRLPFVQDSEKHTEFNGFYEKISERYLSLPQKTSYGAEAGALPAVISVDFCDISDVYADANAKTAKKNPRITVIKRILKINVQEKITEKEYLDLYDEEKRLFIG